MMNRLIGQSAYAEDQRHASALLTTHVVHRFSNAGTLIGTVIGIVRILRPSALPKSYVVLRSAGTGLLAGGVLGAGAVWGRMRGKEEIEWKDRAWRILGNEGQNVVDEGSVVGMLVGGAAAAMRGSGTQLGWRGALGGAGAGGLAGIAIAVGLRKARGEATKAQPAA